MMVKLSFNDGEDIFYIEDIEQAEQFVEMCKAEEYTHKDQILTNKYKKHEILEA